MIPALEHRWKQLLLLASSGWILLSFVVNVLAVPNLVQNTEANLWGYQQHLTSLSFGLLLAYPVARATIGPSPRPNLEWQPFLSCMVSSCACPSGAALASTHRTALLDAWLLVGMWGRPNHAGTTFLAALALRFWPCLQLKLSAGGRLGCAQPWTASATPTLVRYDLVALGWLWMTRPRRLFRDNTNDHHSEGTV